MMRKMVAYVGLLAIAIGSGANIGAAQTPPAVDRKALMGNDGDYALGAGDKLQITVYGEEELSGEQQVGPDGTIALPLIGRVAAAGRPVAAVSDEVRAKLAEGFLHNPSVTITITTYRPFYILGEVNTPGQYEYAKGMTALAAVARAGGFTYRAKKGEIFLKREGGGAEERVKLTSDLPIHPGDTIRVGERYF